MLSKLLVFPPAIAAPVLAGTALLIVEMSAGPGPRGHVNDLGLLVACGLGAIAVGLSTLTLFIGSVGRFVAPTMPGGRPVARVAEWTAIVALVVAAIVVANAIESGVGRFDLLPRR